MKKFLLISAFALSGIVFFHSCEDDLFDITKNVVFENEFVVSTSNINFAEVQVVDLASQNDIIAEYGSKIKNFEVQKVRYWLKSHNGSTTQKVNRILIQVSNPDQTDPQTMVQLDNINLSQLVANPQVFDYNKKGADKLGKLISKKPHQFAYLIATSGNETPYDFVLVVEVTAKLTANVLKKN